MQIETDCPFCTIFCGRNECPYKEENMLKTDLEFFNEDWHMSPYGENGVLFTAEYARLIQMRGFETRHLQSKAYTACRKALRDTGDEPLSHDNMTAIVCLSKQFHLGLEKKYTHRDWKRRAHPRDIAFYLWAMGGLWKLLALPLMPILIISMFWACWHKQISNGVLDTDGKLLAWLRFETFDWGPIRLICTWIIKYRHGLNWADIFAIYFMNRLHPNRRHSRRIYES